MLGFSALSATPVAALPQEQGQPAITSGSSAALVPLTGAGVAIVGVTALAASSAGTLPLSGTGTATIGVPVGGGGIIKAGVDEGPATWFYIETVGYSQAEGNSGVTAFTTVVRRGGKLTGTNNVTATVSANGPNPANAADFQGGVFPSQVLSFGPGEITKTFTANVVGDTHGETDETFAVTLSAPSGGAVLVASGKDTITCTIANDDSAVIGTFVWLGQTLVGAPALAGSPPGAVYLNVNETTQVNRGGIGLRARGAGATANDFFFANTPGWRMDNSFQGLELIIAAGTWEIGFIAASDPFGGGIGGTVFMVDDPAGAATVRQSVVLDSAAAASQALLMNTAGGFYTSASTAVPSAINALTYLPVTVTNLGGGMGRVQIYANSETTLAAIAVRQV